MRKLEAIVVHRTEAKSEAKIKLQILFEKPTVRISKVISFRDWEAMVLPAFTAVQFARLYPRVQAHVKDFTTLSNWLANMSKVCISPIKRDYEVPGTYGTLFIFSSRSTTISKQIGLPTPLTFDGSLIVMLAVRRQKPEPKSVLFARKVDALNIPRSLIQEPKGMKYSLVTNTKGSYYLHMLERRLRAAGSEAVDIGRGSPDVIFIHLGSNISRIKGLAHRRLKHPRLRFISFGRSPLWPEAEHGFREIWAKGDLP
jgi:hypothetical protein